MQSYHTEKEIIYIATVRFNVNYIEQRYKKTRESKHDIGGSI